MKKPALNPHVVLASLKRYFKSPCKPNPATQGPVDLTNHKRAVVAFSDQSGHAITTSAVMVATQLSLARPQEKALYLWAATIHDAQPGVH